MRNLPWPEMPSSAWPDRSLRDLLDYLVWMTREMRQLGFHSGSERDEWCRRCQTAYSALFLPMLPGFGDPYPPDVPPARNPGIWPDIPAATIPGMTLRHQLTVMEMLCRQLREKTWPHARPEDIRTWDDRLARAFTALDHGEAMPMPEDAATEASEEAMEAAQAAEKALRDAARKRSRQLRQQFTAVRGRKKAKKKAAKAKAAPTKKAAAKKKAAPKKKAAKKKAAKKKPAPKKKAAKKKAAKKKAAPKKKTAKKKAAKKKA